ncbi:MAG: hypothetical protein KJ630_04950, partial [Proteobacteria bacterium]|nr:hypothetical protein [Pseudomonadota bacterium]
MRTLEKNSYSVPAQSLLDLVKKLSIGQRSVDTLEQLAIFLHDTLFPKLGPFFIEIYFPSHSSENYLPIEPTGGSEKRQHFVPQCIPADHSLILKMRESGCPVQFCDLSPRPDFLSTTENPSHLLAPILVDADLFG